MKKGFLFAGLIVLIGLPLSGLSLWHAPSVRIHTFNLGLANVHLLQGEKNLLIDTGPPDKEHEIEAALAEAGLKPEDLSLIILTHGHGDHAGGTAYFQETYGIPVLAGKGEEDMLRSGKNRPLTPLSTWGKLLLKQVDMPFPPFTPDLWLTEELDLRMYGIPGRVIPLPGHTAGSLAVLLDSGEAFVGDLLRGGMVARKKAHLHFFHEDRALAERQLQILLDQGIREFYPGHWGPLRAEEVRKGYPFGK